MYIAKYVKSNRFNNTNKLKYITLNGYKLPEINLTNNKQTKIHTKVPNIMPKFDIHSAKNVTVIQLSFLTSNIGGFFF